MNDRVDIEAQQVAPRDEAPADLERGRPNARWRALRTVGPTVAVYVGIVVLWQVLVRVLDIPAFIIPAPTEIAVEGYVRFDAIVENALVTLSEVVIAFLIATAASIPLGLLIVYSKTLERIIYPLLVTAQSTPGVALAPILVVWFGYGLEAKVALAVIMAAFPIIINTVVGMKQTPQEVLDLFRAYRSNAVQLFYKARLFVAAPSIFAGLRVGVTLAVVGAVVGEFISSSEGMGYLLLVANNNINIPLVFASIIALAVISTSLFYLVTLIEVLIVPKPLRMKAHSGSKGA